MQLQPLAMLAAAVWAFFGIIVLVVGFYLVDALTPYKLWEQIVEKQNTALGIVVGSIALAMGLIIASAMH
jgi:uncharacterized membrane protein YjfL (UPF0719 family)